MEIKEIIQYLKDYDIREKDGTCYPPDEFGFCLCRLSNRKCTNPIQGDG